MDEILLAKANEGELEAMLKVSRAYFVEESNIFEAIEWARRIVELHDTKIVSYENLCSFLNLHGHTYYEIGNSERAMEILLETIEIVDFLRENEYYPENIRKIETSASMNCVKIAFENQNIETLMKFLPRVDKKLRPYAVVIKAFINSENKDNSYIREEFQELKEAVMSPNWSNDIEKAFAYYLLANHYLLGTVEKNIDLAYEYMKASADLGLALAQQELYRFSKNFFGKITYK